MKANQKAPNVPEGVNLNIGCGAKIWDGFINIDYPGNWSGKKPDIECDIRSIPLTDDYADSVYSIHVLEHFQRWETEDVLKEWVRMLKPSGRLVIEVPCLDKVLGIFKAHIEQGTELNPRTTLFRLYGDPNYRDEHMMHKWCFSAGELIELVENAGIEQVTYEEPEYHIKHCDMRITGVKKSLLTRQKSI